MARGPRNRQAGDVGDGWGLAQMTGKSVIHDRSGGNTGIAARRYGTQSSEEHRGWEWGNQGTLPDEMPEFRK